MAHWSGRQIDGRLVFVRKEITNAFIAMCEVLGIGQTADANAAEAMLQENLERGHILAGTDIQVREYLREFWQQCSQQNRHTLRLQHRKLLDECERYLKHPLLQPNDSQFDGAQWCLRLQRLLGAMEACRQADAKRRPELVVTLAAKKKLLMPVETAEPVQA